MIFPPKKFNADEIPLFVSSFYRPDDTGSMHSKKLAIDITSYEFSRPGKLRLVSLTKYIAMSVDIISRMTAGKLLIDMTFDKFGMPLNPHFHYDFSDTSQIRVGWELHKGQMSGLFSSRGDAINSLYTKLMQFKIKPFIVEGRPEVENWGDVPESVRNIVNRYLIPATVEDLDFEKKIESLFKLIKQYPVTSAVTALFILFVLSSTLTRR